MTHWFNPMDLQIATEPADGYIQIGFRDEDAARLDRLGEAIELLSRCLAECAVPDWREVDPNKQFIMRRLGDLLSPTLPPQAGGTPGSDGVQPGSTPDVSSPNG